MRHYLLAGFFFNMAAENRFVLISFNGIEGILKDGNYTKMQQKSGSAF